MDAIHYSIDHDDGNSTKDYDEAEIILVGVSRSCKTPVSVFLATQMGIKMANYPLVRDELDSFRVPSYLIRNKKKIVALTASPQLLHQIPIVMSDGKSIEETATQVTQKLNLKSKAIL